MHILNAFSKSPKTRLLPNPYDKKSSNKYKIEDAGLRLRYDVKDS